MAVKIQLRRGTAAQWTAANPILAAGEIGLELDTDKRKIGDGVNVWGDLPYDLTQSVADGLYATSEQGERADSAVQPETVAILTPGPGQVVVGGDASPKMLSRAVIAPESGVSRLLPAPVEMASPPVITAGSAGAATVITNSVLVSWKDAAFRILGGPMPPPYDPTGPWLTGMNTLAAGRIPYAVEFNYDGDEIELLMRGGGSTSAYRLMIDGQYVDESWAPDFPPDMASYLVHVDFGSEAVRRITIELDSFSQFGGVRRGPTATVFPVTVPRGPRVIALGDSWTQGANSQGNKWRDGFVHRTARILGWPDTWASGIGGTGYINTGGSKTYGQRLQDDVLQYHPDVVIVSGGTNDANLSATTGQVETAARAVFEAIKSSAPTPLLIVVRPFSSKGTASAGLLAVDAGVALAAPGIADIVIDPIAEKWITGSGNVAAPANDGNADRYIVSDHPTMAGYRYLGSRLAAAIATHGEL